MNAATNGVTNKVAENLASVRERLLLAASEAGRDPHSILLIGVSKRQPLERVIQAYEAGLRDFGENTVQGLLERIEEFKARGLEARWHFIGRLQRNKLNKLLAYPVIIHTVDSQKMASAL
ncbi:YggS family pyridoxal phosphate-dependent enzyme, partial [Myxococcota bacterium]|nr:YggS family pyridoxal phosphate-dependent enzyme [Myxococcota bacterium]